MTQEIVYDLTEVLRASTGKLRYYGIVRVVAEVGAELFRLDPSIRFCVHSPGHDGFFEIFPSLDPDGRVALNVPLGLGERAIRSRFYGRRNLLRDLIAPRLRALANRRNRGIWERAGVNLPTIDIEGKVYLSCARPKLIVDAMETLRRRGTSCRLVPYLHDMIPLHDFLQKRQSSFPTNFIGDNRTLIAQSALILANSEFTRSDILEFSARGELPPVPEVVAVPLVHECPEGTEPPEHPVPAEPYVLTVGAATGRKNLEAVFEALLRLEAEGRPVPLCVLAGTYRKRTKVFLDASRFDPIRDRIVIRHSPNQTDLVALYRGAVALLIPSRMEGWGLPAGEALWCGTPAICSTASVFREVCGDLGLYFDPDSPAELAAHIARLMGDAGFAADLRTRIAAARPRLRTWRHVASDMLAAVRERV